MEQEAKATLTDTHRFWLDHIKRCRELNQPMAVYAKSNGLIVTTLYYWNKRLRALGLLAEDQARVSFTSIEFSAPPRAAGGFRVHFPNGVVIQWEVAPQGAQLDQCGGSAGGGIL